MRGFFIALLLATTTQSLHAQRTTGPSPANGDSTRRTPAIVRTVSESIVFDAEPRSFQVVRVPIPSAIRAAADLTYEIEPQAAFVIIGPRRGALTGAAAESDLLITVRVPADARAGAHMAAHAIFRAGRNQVDVPIETRVKSVFAIALRIETELNGIQVGDRVELRASVSNMGNAVDSVRLSFEAPAPWRTSVRDTILVIPQGQVAHKLIRLSVPRNSSTGSFFFRTNAMSRGDSATQLTTLAVGNRSANMAPPGPTVRLALGGVGVQDGSSAGIAQIAVSGPLTTGISIDGRAALQTTTSASSIRGLSRVGAYVTEPHLAAWSSTWRVGLGSTVSNFNDVLGVNAGGRGVGLDYDDQKNILHVTAAKQIDTGIGTTGSIVGAEYERRAGFMMMGGGVSRLRGTGFGNQSLSAAALQAKASPRKSLLLEGTLAYRDYETGSGMGWIAGVSGNLPRTHAQLRMVHAAGGANAFARAEDELIASAQTAWNERLEVSTSFFRTSDPDVGSNQVRSNVFSVAPVYRLAERTALRGEIRASRFEVEGNPFSFTNGELHVGAGASTTYKGINLTTDAGIDRLSRGIRTDLVDAEDTGTRMSWRGAGSRSLSFGVMQVEASYDHNDRSTGFVAHQMMVIARAEHAQLPGMPRNLFIDAEAGLTHWAGIQTFATLRAGATYMVRRDTEIAANLERNPMLYTSSTGTPVVFSVRVERSLGMPRMITGRAAGIVFQDYNANGMQDMDEPGMPNIAVRRGGSRATTDREGRYRFWEQGRGATVIDVATLPLGWIVSAVGQDGNIALLPTTRVEVTIQLGMAERLRKLDITLMNVTARDAQGRTWIARRSGETAVFEALPVGNYEIGIDATGLPEPIHIEGLAPRVKVSRESVTRILLPLAGRPLRFKQNP